MQECDSAIMRIISRDLESLSTASHLDVNNDNVNFDLRWKFGSEKGMQMHQRA